MCRFQGKCHPKQSLHRDKPVPRRFRPGCRGRSPRQSKLKISPVPAGEERSASAGGGIGGRKASGRQWQPVRQNKPTPAAEQADTANKPQKNKKGRSRAFNQNFQPSNLSSHYHKIHLQPKRRKRRGEKETQTNEEPLHRIGARGSSPRSISIG